MGNQSNVGGMVLGGLAGIYTSMKSIVVNFWMVFSLITWEMLENAVALAAVGGIVGWVVPEILKYIKMRIVEWWTKRKRKKIIRNNKKHGYSK